MLTEAIKRQIEKLAPEPLRQNIRAVKEILASLSINEDSLFAQLYLTYTGPFDPSFQDVEILEITDIISPNVLDMTEYFREHYGLPPRCVALSDDAFGILRLYHIDKDVVMEIEMGNIESLENVDAIHHRKRWESFEEFLNDFFLAKA